MTNESLDRAKQIKTLILDAEYNIESMKWYVKNNKGLYICGNSGSIGEYSPSFNFSLEELQKFIQADEDFIKELQQEFENL